MSSATTTAIPLTNLPQQSTASNSNVFAVNTNNISNSNNQIASQSQPSTAQAAAATLSGAAYPGPSQSLATNSRVLSASPNSQASLLPRYANVPATWKEKFANACSVANGLGTFALIAAVIFGIGAWVGMKIQISQGGKSMELAIWTACADHEAIQDSKMCRSIMAKDFSAVVTRDLQPEAKEMTVIVKRGLSDSDELMSDEVSSSKPVAAAPPITQNRISKLIASISDTDQGLVNPKTQYHADYTVDPAIRATIFPLVDLLSRPLRWTFDFIESILLLIVFCIHKVLSWMTWFVIFIVQAMIYSYVEKFVQSLLASLDLVIWNLMPSWMPYLLASNIASWMGLSALRSFWYGTNYLNSLKWIFIFRLSMWSIVEGVKIGYNLWTIWRAAVEQRRLQQERRSQPAWMSFVGSSQRDTTGILSARNAAF